MNAAAKCPKCLKLVRVLPEKTARGCSKCGRWQYLYQAPFAGFFEATFKHLASVACGQGAWCRDMVEGPGADACARLTHVHPVGECPGDVRQDPFRR
jgi:hypothetical protein